jgi:hypothetical protein
MQIAKYGFFILHFAFCNFFSFSVSQCLFPSMSTNQPPPITDSPWFWVLLFSLMGLVALAAISGQYGKRQARLERQYQARERIRDEAVGDPGRRDYSIADKTLIPIWPLAVPLGGVVVLAAVMLGREHQRRRHEPAG